MENSEASEQNYNRFDKVIELYSEFKEEINTTLSEFMNFSAKFKHNIDFLRDTLDIFKKITK